MSKFSATPSNPYHLSVGAVFIDESNQIICHKYPKVGNEKIGYFENLHILMHESLEDNETIEKTLDRGLMEEFGAKGEIICFLGVKQFKDKWFGEIGKERVVEKNIVYFLVRLIEMDESKRIHDHPEFKSEIIRISMYNLIQEMRKQKNKYHIDEFDSSEIIEKAAAYIQHSTGVSLLANDLQL